MRPRYKIGQFIQTVESEESASATGIIEAVVIRAEGVSYQISTSQDEVNEGDVAAVFRPVTPRKPKALAKSGSKKDKASKAA